MAAVTIGMFEGVPLVLAPIAAATDNNGFCNFEQSFVPQVVSETTALQSVTRKPGWKWTDQPVQDATNTILQDYNTNLFSPPHLLTSASALYYNFTQDDIQDNGDSFTTVYASYPQFGGDSKMLLNAMNEQLDTLRNADTPSDVLPDSVATLAAAKTLDNDCHVGP